MNAIQDFIKEWFKNGFIGFAARIFTGGGGGSKNRFLDLATTYASGTNSASWTQGDNVTEIFLTHILDTGATGNELDKDFICKINIDATSDPVVVGWFAQGASGTLNHPNFRIIPGKRFGPITFPSYITRLDALPVTAGELLIEAS